MYKVKVACALLAETLEILETNRDEYPPVWYCSISTCTVYLIYMTSPCGLLGREFFSMESKLFLVHIILCYEFRPLFPDSSDPGQLYSRCTEEYKALTSQSNIARTQVQRDNVETEM
jgi:hypothetical protein